MEKILRVPRLICIKKVCEITDLGKTTVLLWESQSRFPRAIRLSATKRVWYEPDVHEWIMARRAESLALIQEVA